MIFKRMLKFALCAMLLGASSSAFAEDQMVNEVTLGDGSTTNWAGVVSAINTGTSALEQEYNDSVAAANKWLGIYNELKDQLASLKDQRNNLPNKYTVEPKSWLKTVYEKATEFQGYYNTYRTSGGTTDPSTTVYYKISQTDFEDALYVSFVAQTLGDQENSWKKASNISTIYNAVKAAMTTPNVIEETYVYLGEEYPENNGNLTVANGTVRVLANNIVAAITNLTTQAAYQTNVPTAEYNELTNQINAIENGTPAVGNPGEEGYVPAVPSKLSVAKGLMDNANTKAATLKTDLDNFAVKYNTITLLADVTVETSISKAFNGTIYGKGFVINANVNPFSGAFTGTLTNAAVNYSKGGKFAESTNGAKFEDVVSWNGTTGAFYDANGVRTAYSEFGELGMAARELFGVNMTTAKFVKLDDSNKLYKLTVYNSATQQATTYKVGSELEDDNLLAPNVFAQSATADVKGMGLTNVYYGSSNTCENVVITDKTNFYCPTDITAVQTTYNRTFTGTKNVACLPFELTTNMAEGLQYVCTYNEELAGKFWFTEVASGVAANTPVLLVGTSDFELGVPANTIIAKTPDSQIVMEEGNTNEPSKAFGLFKKAYAGEINGKSNEAKVYSLSGDDFKFVPTNNATKPFSPFRMVVYSESASVNKAPREIVITDENGVEISDIESSAVENVMADANFSIVAGQGVINFTSEADYGNVEIYSINGNVAAVADVVAGTTTVELEKGIYVVMGKKVLVK